MCMFKVLCSILLTLSLPVYQNAHVNSLCAKVSFHSMFILFSLVLFTNTKGNTCLEEFLMLLMDRNCNYFILTEIFGQNRSHEKLIQNFFFIQSQSRIDFLTRGKSRFIQSEISCWNESVSSQTRSRCFWRLFNVHSQKFVEFPQDYSSCLENLP